MEKDYALTVPSIPKNAQRHMIIPRIGYPSNTQVTVTVVTLVVAETAPAVA
jgi:hypothetical protein